MKSRAQVTLEYTILFAVVAATAAVFFGLAFLQDKRSSPGGRNLVTVGNILKTSDGYPVGYDKILAEPVH